MIEWTQLEHPEERRTYVYPCGFQYEVRNVVRVAVRPSGNHRLETVDGEKFIVAAGWKVMVLHMKEWTF